MKTHIRLSLLAGFMLLLTNACSDLTENPDFTLSSENVFSNETTVQNAFYGILNRMAVTNFQGRLVMTSELGSGLFWGGGRTFGQRYAGLDVTQSALYLQSAWIQGYGTIAQVNYFLQFLDNSALDQPLKDKFRGQALFIRAFVYLQLSNQWGGLPLVLQPVTGLDNAYAARADQDEVFDQIARDLLEAIDKLEQNNNHAEINEWAARALLAKVYFIRASREDENNGTNSAYWQKAKEQGDMVISKGPYELDSSFENLWNGYTPSPEHIFKLDYMPGAVGPVINQMSREFSPSWSNQNRRTLGRVRVDRALFDSYQEKYPGDDPRLEASFFYNSYQRWHSKKQIWETKKLYPEWKRSNYFGRPFIKKHFDMAQEADASTKDFAFLRYADLILLMAEVENELDNPMQAQTYVNMVLKRARTADGNNSAEPADWPVLSKEDFRREIFFERHYELIGEGKSYIEVRRRGIAYFRMVLQRHNEGENLITTGNVNGRDYVYDLSDDNLRKNLYWPIPRAEFAFNRAMTPADQNYGYTL